MAVDYVNSFAQLGAELKNLRKLEAIWEHSAFSDGATFSRRLLSAAYDDTDNIEDDALVVGKAGHKDSIGPASAANHESQKAIFESAFFPVLDAEISPSDDELAGGAISYNYDEALEASGQIKILERIGRFGVLRRRMISGSEDILKNTITPGAFTADGQNTGTLAQTGFSAEDHTLTGELVFTVTDDTIDNLTLSVINVLTKRLVDDTRQVEAERSIRVGQSFEEGQTGLTFTLSFNTPVEAGDDGLMINTPVFTTPTESDTDRGKIYLKVTRQAGDTWLIEWFNLGSRVASSLVQSTSTTTLIGTFAADMLGPGGMRVQFNFDRAAADTHLPVVGNTDSDISLDLVAPREGDRWTQVVTNDEAGNFASKLARRYRASLNSVAAGNTISDALAASVTVI